MSAALDRRQVRTQQAILDAFVALLFEGGYSRVTMAAVAERANVGRSTLYEHFRAKADLLAHGMGPLLRVIAGCTAADPPVQLPAVLAHMRENQAVGRILLLPPTRAVLMKVLTAEIAVREEVRPGPLPRPLICEQIAAALMAILEPWIVGRIGAPLETVARAMHRTGRALAAAQADSEGSGL